MRAIQTKLSSKAQSDYVTNGNNKDDYAHYVKALWNNESIKWYPIFIMAFEILGSSVVCLTASSGLQQT